MKKVCVSLLSIAVASFVYFFNPDFSFAIGQYNCSDTGISCQGVNLEFDMYNNGTYYLWVDKGDTIHYAVANSIESNHTIDFFATGPNGWKSATHLVPINDLKQNFYDVAPYSGYYMLHLECDYQQAADCKGWGEIWTNGR